MERWTEFAKGCIPEDFYEVKIINGEEQGLVIELYGNAHKVSILFGWVFAIRILDEGVVQTNLYAEKELEKFRSKNFKNIIYSVEDAEFERSVMKIAGGYSEVLEMMKAKHFIIITPNFNIDIIAVEDPKIRVES